jgi:hypothetical protein
MRFNVYLNGYFSSNQPNIEADTSDEAIQIAVSNIDSICDGRGDAYITHDIEDIDCEMIQPQEPYVSMREHYTNPQPAVQEEVYVPMRDLLVTQAVEEYTPYSR